MPACLLRLPAQSLSYIWKPDRKYFYCIYVNFDSNVADSATLTFRLLNKDTYEQKYWQDASVVPGWQQLCTGPIQTPVQASYYFLVAFGGTVGTYTFDEARLSTGAPAPELVVAPTPSPSADGTNTIWSSSFEGPVVDLLFVDGFTVHRFANAATNSSNSHNSTAAAHTGSYGFENVLRTGAGYLTPGGPYFGPEARMAQFTVRCLRPSHPRHRASLRCTAFRVMRYRVVYRMTSLCAVRLCMRRRAARGRAQGLPQAMRMRYMYPHAHADA